MYKMLILVLLILVFMIIIYLLFFRQKEYFKETRLDKNYTGFPFFEKTYIPNINSNMSIPEYNGYCLVYSPDKNNCKFDNTNTKIREENVFYDIGNVLKTFNGDIIGKLNITNNESFNIKGKYGESDFNINKVISGQNNLPGTLTNANTNVPINMEINKNLNTKKDLPDTGYSKYIKDIFISYINSKSSYNFIALNNGNVNIVVNKDNSKLFTIPFFIYEAKLNYTKGIVGIFTIKQNLDIQITKIIEEDIIQDTLNLKPANINNTIFENMILDTNGYFEIKNRLGLMYPFRTSTTGIIQPADTSKFFKKISESDTISANELQTKIKNYEILNEFEN